VQIAGKVRYRLEVAPGIAAEELERRALASAKVQDALGGAEIMKIIVRAPKIVNIVPKR
jgi:leucyl-tRNA synthetase